MMLKAEKISRRFFRKRKDANFFYAVQDVTITLHPGQFVSLFGRSGSGKSTLLSMLSGLLEPTDGQVMFGDADLYKMEDGVRSQFRNEHFGVVPQGQATLQSLTVLENVLLPCTLFGTPSSQEYEHAIALLKETGISEIQDARSSELSGGEMRRMAIARALMRDPDVILADEPTADLDDENTAVVLELLQTAARQGKIVLIATHDKETLNYADSVYRMDAGKCE